jgi:hypothetical protein
MPTNFLWNAGTSNNGLLASAVTLQSTELNSVTNSSIAVSSVGGAGGVFKNSDTAQAIYGEIFLTLGAIASALAAGACVAGWFIESFDGGTTFEQSSAAESRAPDFVIPLPATAISGGSVFKASDLARLPALPFKVMLQNNTGQTLNAAGNSLKCAPVAVQY